MLNNSYQINFYFWLTLALLTMFLGFNVESYININTIVFIKVNHFLSFAPEQFWDNATNLGDALILVPLVSFIFLVNKRCFFSIIFSLPLGVFLIRGLKSYFAIPRPAAVLNSSEFNIIGDTLTALNSFPSGHSATVFGVLFAVMLTYLIDNKNRFKKMIVVGFFLISVVVALSRVAVGAHWPVDAVFGASIGVLAGYSGEYLTRRYAVLWYWAEKKQLIYSLLLLLFPVFISLGIYSGKLDAILVVWMALFFRISSLLFK